MQPSWPRQHRRSRSPAQLTSQTKGPADREPWHEEALPTRRLVFADAAKAIAGDVLVGCSVTLGFVTFAMLVASAALPDAL